MAPTFNKLFVRLSEALGKTESAVEAYGLALRSVGWWKPTKRGRGASIPTDMDAAKLLLALLSGGPTELPGFFLRYANACPMPAMKNTALVRAVCRELNLADDAKFLEFVAALVRLYREGETDRLIYFSPSPEGFRDSFLYDGPNVELRVKGPFPIATISFHLALPLIDRLKREDEDGESLMGQQTLVFLDQLYGWHAEAESEKRDTSPYDGAILELRKHTARGIGFDRFIGGREFSAVASALRGDEGSEAKELAP